MPAVLKVACLLLLPAVLNGCAGMLAGDICPDVGPAASDPPKKRNCDDSFFSAPSQRSVLYSGNDAPRLANGEPERQGDVVDTRSINQPARSVEPFVGYEGGLRINFPADENAVTTDITNLRTAGAKRFDPTQKVAIDFNKSTIDFMLKQLLGGALGVNFIAPDNLGGSITFRTEEPIPKSQVLQVVRDILSRNGLAMKFINGVFHIGRPELIATIDTTSQAGQANEMVTRIVQLNRGTSQDIVAVARQLFPESVVLLPSNVAGTVIVRASPSDIDQVEETLKSISGAAVGEDRVAVIPLRQIGPEQMATQLTELYRSRIAAGAEMPTIIALERQQAILVATKDRTKMAGIRKLVQELDRDNSDKATLRVIPLRNISATDIAQNLATIFGTSGGPAAGSGKSGTDTSGRQSPSSRDRRAPMLPPGQLAPQRPPQDDEDGSEQAPGFSLPGGLAARGRGAAGGSGSGGNRPGGAAAGVGGGGGAEGENIRVVADPRTNSIMLYSTFAVYKRVRDVIAALDVPESQVVIEATIVEVELNDRLDRGVQFFLQSPYVNGRSSSDLSGASGSGTGTGPTVPKDTGSPGGFLQVGANFGAYRVDAVLTALQQVTKTKVISSPYVTVTDSKTARLVIGDQIPYTSRQQQSNNSGNVTVTEEIEIKDTGVILEVTPKINANNSVSMKISQSVSTPIQTAQGGNQTPVISTRSVDSNVLVQSGRTILLGGLIQDRLETLDSGIPVLRTVPMVGDLFKTDSDRVRRVELIVMITPRVSRVSSQIEDVTRLIRSQLHTR